MRNAVNVVLVFLVIVGAAGCSKSEPPPQATSGQDSHPVKNVESLPSGTIREGARTMNKGADMGSTLEQQKQERDKEMEAQSK
jgi:hypothetical protein